jgi:hypothetical protein
MIKMNFVARNGIKALLALVAVGVVYMVAEPYLAASPSASRSQSTEVDSRPRVEVVHPRRITVAHRLQTNTTLEAFEETDLFAGQRRPPFSVITTLEIVRLTAGSMVALGRTTTLERSRGQPCRRVCQHWSAAPRRSDPSRDVAGVRERESAKLVDDARPGNLDRHTFFCFVRPILSRFNESDDVRSPNFGPVANN